MDKTLIYPFAAALAGGLTTWFMVWGRKRTAQVEMEKRQEEAPLAALERVLNQQQNFLEELLKSDKRDREESLKALTEIAGTLRTMHGEMVEHRAEERERTAKIHDRFNSINDKLSEIKGQGARRYPNGEG